MYERPANVFVGGFIGTPPMNMIAGTIKADGRDLVLALPHTSLTIPPSLAHAIAAQGLERIILGVRPEHLTLSSTGAIPAVVAVVESLGHERQVVCRLETDGGDELIVARQSSELPSPRLGDHVQLAARPERLHAFDPASGTRLEPAR